MNVHVARAALAALVALLPAAGLAEDRPAEEELFGAPPAEEPPAAAGVVAPDGPSAPGGGRDEAILGGRPRERPAGILTAAQDNPLTLGGQVYLRATTSWSRGVAPSDWGLRSPNLVDLYLDARPNDRVRAFALARTSWSPLAPAASTAGIPAPAASTEPRALLDQLWVNFDLGRRVFVTAGRQHVKWGVGRFWNPTDFLHPVRRDPLAPFDDRTGTTMVKLHVPWEARGWNLYGIALLDDPAGQGDEASVLGKVAGGARAEVVLGTAELGADAVVRRGQRPRFGLDFSAGIWDLDVHGEVALRTSSDVPLWEEVDPAAPIVGRYGRRSLDGIAPQAVIGVSYAFNYSDEDALRVAAEYFYNGLGYDDAHIYPWLLVEPSWFGPQADAIATALGYTKTNDFTPFYVGRHYAGLNVLLAAPGSLNDHTFSLSAIVNASDGSAIVRVDHSVLVNTWLTVESFLAGSFGKEGGEFRFALDVPPQTLPGAVVTPPLRTPPPVLSGGVALRMSL